MQIEEFLEHNAERTPEKTALICGPHHLTYAALETRSNQLAHVLLSNGLCRWDRVVVHLPGKADIPPRFPDQAAAPGLRRQEHFR